MATEKKLKDPAEAALSAVEQALNLGPDDAADKKSERNETDSSSNASPAKADASADVKGPGRAAQTEDASQDAPDEPRLPAIEEDELTRRFDRNALDEELSARRAEGERQAGVVSPDRTRVANDDRQSIGMLMQAMQVRPSRKPYGYAAMASLAWIGALIGLASLDGGLGSMIAGWGAAQTAIAGAVMLVPTIFFFTAAVLAVRSQEMKLVARSMGEVAMRLAEPESFSTDAVLTVSQAVRREVAAVGDGIERALARAGELETLVRSEISTLERAYSDNEIRIRSLVDELIAQREAIVANAERVRRAISGSHETFAQDLDKASQRIVEAISATGDRVSGSIESRGEHITTALGRAGEQVVDDMASRGEELVQRLGGVTDEVRSGISKAGEELAAAITARADEFRASLEETSGALSGKILESAESVTRSLAETGDQVNRSLADQGEQLRSNLESTASKLEESFAARGSEINERLEATGHGIAEELGNRGTRMREEISAGLREIGEDLGRRGDEVVARLAEKSTEAVARLDEASQRMEAGISRSGEEFNRNLDEHTEKTREKLADTGKSVALAIAGQGTRINDALRQSGETVSGLVGEKAGEIEKLLGDRLAGFETIIVERGGKLEQDLGERTRQIEQSLDTRTAALTEALTARSHDLETTIDSRTEMLTGKLGERTQQIEQSLDTHTAALTEALTERTRSLETTIDARSEALTGAIGTRTEAFEQAVNAGSDKLSGVIGDNLARIETALLRDGGALVDKFSRDVETMSGVISGRFSEIDRVINIEGKGAWPTRSATDPRLRRHASETRSCANSKTARTQPRPPRSPPASDEYCRKSDTTSARARLIIAINEALGSLRTGRVMWPASLRRTLESRRLVAFVRRRRDRRASSRPVLASCADTFLHQGRWIEARLGSRSGGRPGVCIQRSTASKAAVPRHG